MHVPVADLTTGMKIHTAGNHNGFVCSSCVRDGSVTSFTLLVSGAEAACIFSGAPFEVSAAYLFLQNSLDYRCRRLVDLFVACVAALSTLSKNDEK